MGPPFIDIVQGLENLRRLLLWYVWIFLSYAGLHNGQCGVTTVSRKRERVGRWMAGRSSHVRAEARAVASIWELEKCRHCPAIDPGRGVFNFVFCALHIPSALILLPTSLAISCKHGSNTASGWRCLTYCQNPHRLRRLQPDRFTLPTSTEGSPFRHPLSHHGSRGS